MRGRTNLFFVVGEFLIDLSPTQERAMRDFSIAASVAFAVMATLALSPAKAQTLVASESGCWLNTNGTNYHWGECAKTIRTAVSHPRATSSFALAGGGPAIASEAGCWVNTNGTNYRWGACPRR
jgi:hypothetical protein